MSNYNVAEIIDSPSALTQEQGDIIYRLVSEAIDKQKEIHLDFKDVESMISPFLNNAIGQLYGKYTSEQIKTFLRLDNFPQNKNSTLNIVISNAKKFYENKQQFKNVVKDNFDVD